MLDHGNVWCPWVTEMNKKKKQNEVGFHAHFPWFSLIPSKTQKSDEVHGANTIFRPRRMSISVEKCLTLLVKDSTKLSTAATGTTSLCKTRRRPCRQVNLQSLPCPSNMFREQDDPDPSVARGLLTSRAGVKILQGPCYTNGGARSLDRFNIKGSA